MREVQFREAVAEAMSEEMRRDKNVFLMGKKSPNTTARTKLRKECSTSLVPERVIDTPIAELGFASCCCRQP